LRYLTAFCRTEQMFFCCVSPKHLRRGMCPAARRTAEPRRDACLSDAPTSQWSVYTAARSNRSMMGMRCATSTFAPSPYMISPLPIKLVARAHDATCSQWTATATRARPKRRQICLDTLPPTTWRGRRPSNRPRARARATSWCARKHGLPSSCPWRCAQ